jgi:integrase
MAPLFGEFLSHDAVNRRHKRVTLALLGERRCAHAIRHTVACHLLDAGVDVAAAAAQLGNLPTTTEKYYARRSRRSGLMDRLVGPEVG